MKFSQAEKVIMDSLADGPIPAYEVGGREGRYSGAAMARLRDRGHVAMLTVNGTPYYGLRTRSSEKMTLAKLVQRLQGILAERPDLAELPVYVRREKSRRKKEYLPILYASGATTQVGDLRMVELVADDDNPVVW